MITTKIDPPLLTPSFKTVIPVDTKANMLEAAEIWGFRFPKSWRKDELAQALDYHLKHSTQYIWGNLGQEAIDMIGEIQEAGKGNYITVPHDDEAQPIVFRPALTKNPPQIPEEGRMIAYQLYAQESWN